MKILALSDRVSPLVHSPQAGQRFVDVDLVVGCGDLPFYYLEFVATVLKAPVLYVYGNHDVGQLQEDGTVISHAEGCISIDGRAVREGGLLIAGLGGSPLYNRKTRHQYTEFEMALRILLLVPRLLANRLFKGRFLDLLITHSPIAGVHDAPDHTHRGFKSLRLFVRLFRPRLMLHGHVHLWRRDVKQETHFGETLITNVYPMKVIDWEDLPG